VIFGADRVKEGELYLVRDPLDVLTAYQSGVENVVAFLAPITAQQVEMSAALMDAAHCTAVEQRSVFAGRSSFAGASSARPVRGRRSAKQAWPTMRRRQSAQSQTEMAH
jgi:hypothetical protein